MLRLCVLALLGFSGVRATVNEPTDEAVYELERNPTKIWKYDGYIWFNDAFGCTNRLDVDTHDKAVVGCIDGQFTAGIVDYRRDLYVMAGSGLHRYPEECIDYPETWPCDAELVLPNDGFLLNPHGLTVQDDIFYFSEVSLFNFSFDSCGGGIWQYDIENDVRSVFASPEEHPEFCDADGFTDPLGFYFTVADITSDRDYVYYSHQTGTDAAGNSSTVGVWRKARSGGASEKISDLGECSGNGLYYNHHDRELLVACPFLNFQDNTYPNGTIENGGRIFRVDLEEVRQNNYSEAVEIRSRDSNNNFVDVVDGRHVGSNALNKDCYFASDGSYGTFPGWSNADGAGGAGRIVKFADEVEHQAIRLFCPGTNEAPNQRRSVVEAIPEEPAFYKTA